MVLSFLVVMDSCCLLVSSFSATLTCGLHIQMVWCKALLVLGIIMRLSMDLKLISFKIISCSLVQLISEYGAYWWQYPNGNQFGVRLKGCSVGSCDSLATFRALIVHHMTTLQLSINSSSLVERRRNMGTNFLNVLLADNVDSPTLLLFINFRVPQHTSRSITTFHIPLCTTKYLSNEPLRRMMLNANTDPTFLIQPLSLTNILLHSVSKLSAFRKKD